MTCLILSVPVMVEFEQLISILQNGTDLQERRYIPDKLAKLGDWRSTPFLGKVLIDESTPIILSNECAESLGKQGDPQAVPYLVQALQSPNAELRRTTVWSLGQIGSADTIEPLLSMRFDENKQVRRWVAKSFGRIPLDAVIQPLEVLFSSIQQEDTVVQADLLRALVSQLPRFSYKTVETFQPVLQDLLSSATDQVVIQATCQLLAAMAAIGISIQLTSIHRLLSQGNILARSYLLRILGYSGDLDYLHDLEIDNDVVASRLQAGDTTTILAELEEGKLSGYEATIIKYLSVPIEFPHIQQYLKSDELSVQLAALEYWAKRYLSFAELEHAYHQGKGLHTIIHLMRYYGESLPILRSETSNQQKTHRQAAIESLVSEEFLSHLQDQAEWIQIMKDVSNSEKVWHIRRDARQALQLVLG